MGDLVGPVIEGEYQDPTETKAADDAKAFRDIDAMIDAMIDESCMIMYLGYRDTPFSVKREK
jgi:hypothetical protein